MKNNVLELDRARIITFEWGERMGWGLRRVLILCACGMGDDGIYLFNSGLAVSSSIRQTFAMLLLMARCIEIR